MLVKVIAMVVLGTWNEPTPCPAGERCPRLITGSLNKLRMCIPRRKDRERMPRCYCLKSLAI